MRARIKQADNVDCLQKQHHADSELVGRAENSLPLYCSCLYSKEEFDAMDAALVPEILRVELGSAVLRTRALGINDLSVIREAN